MTTRNHPARIERLMQQNGWTQDRCAYELGCTTFDLRWLLNGYKAESVQQQHRLDAILGRSAAFEDVQPPPTAYKIVQASYVEPAYVQVPGAVERVYRPDMGNRRVDACVNGHAFTRKNTYVSPGGRRQCRTCSAIKSRASKGRSMAARDAIRTMNGRGVRDSEIASVIGVSTSAVSDWRRGGVYATADNVSALQRLVAVTNDLTGNERPNRESSTPHPLIDEIRARFVSVGEREVAA